MSTRRPLVAANWKMNGTLATLCPLVDAVIAGLAPDCPAEVAICPPAVYLAEVGVRLRAGRIALGAQNVSEHADGAYTGEVSAAMLNDYNCRFVVVGHSERRQYYAETDAVVAAKCQVVLHAGMTPIVCVGETLEQREAGETEAVIGRQLDAILAAGAFAPAVVAYEPIWAIGTGRTATPDTAQAVHAFIRARLSAQDAELAATTRILYGGSVKAANAAELFAMADIDGGLIGGASLDAGEFLAICHSTR